MASAVFVDAKVITPRVRLLSELRAEGLWKVRAELPRPPSLYAKLGDVAARHTARKNGLGGAERRGEAATTRALEKPNPHPGDIFDYR